MVRAPPSVVQHVLMRLPALFASFLLAVPLAVLGGVGPASAVDRQDCRDFVSQASAQEHFDRDTSDPDDLDTDGDNIACEDHPGPWFVPPADAENLLVINERLDPGDDVRASLGVYRLVMQSDGNLVLYGNGFPRFATGTSVGGSTATLQPDGNLVVRDPGGLVLWGSNSFGWGSTYASVQDDGNFVIYAPSHGAVIPVWQVGPDPTLYAGRTVDAGGAVFSANKAHKIVMQRDGNFVLYRVAGNVPRWASNTFITGSRLVMQSDGNLVVYSPAGSPRWASGPAGANARAIVQNDGNFVVYRSNGSAFWDAL